MYNLFKNRKLVISTIIILILIAVGYNYFSGSKKPAYDFIVAQKKNLTQEVSVTGNLKPAEDVSISFEMNGKINRVDAKVGDKVVAGQSLAGISDTDARAQLENAEAQLGQYQAAYERELAKLNEMKSGTRPEEIKIAETDVANAQKALTDAQINLENVKNKSLADLSQVYDGAITAAAKSVSVAINSIFVAGNIQLAHFNGSDQDSNKVAEAKAAAVLSLLGGLNAGRWDNDSVNKLSGGAKAATEKAQIDPSDENVGTALGEVKNALQDVKALLDIIPVTSILTSAESANISAEKTNINTEIIAVAAKQKVIDVQKVTNTNSISTAQIAVNNAASSLSSAEDSLALKKAGNTPEEINAQEAQVRQTLANITSQKAIIKQAETKLAQTVIRSPINGVVTMQDAKIGQIVSANIPIVSIISEKRFQIEANVAEADIAKIKIGEIAEITLDAYGSDVVFQAAVIAINPAETVIEGVSTYKTTLQFKEEDGRLKSGMTANTNIQTASRENVIAVPQRLVVTQGENKFVKILNNDGTVSNVNVKTGLRDSEGNVEIISGLSAGEKVIISVTE